MASSAGYSRRRPRKSVIPKTKAPTAKGFAPKLQIGTRTHEKDLGDVEGKAVSEMKKIEKKKELERFASEQAERERETEEMRRREEEKAASEADKVQAKMEVQKKQEVIFHITKLANTSVNNLWHIEPSMFKGNDKVRLYYSRSTRPLEDASKMLIHGGYNDWCEGLTIAERLQKSEKRDGDWWYVEVMCEIDYS